MRAKFFAVLVVLLSSQVGAFACSVCFAEPGSRSAKSMAMAIWFLMGAVMAVLGGLGLFSFHLWRHARMPLEPHQELVDEDLKEYD